MSDTCPTCGRKYQERAFPKRVGLTPRQSELLIFIGEYTRNHGYAPNYDEMLAALGVSSRGNVHKHVQSLIERGYLTSMHRRSRSVAVIA